MWFSSREGYCRPSVYYRYHRYAQRGGLSYSNQLSAANNINTFIGNTSEDIELLALPISHSFGLGRLRCVLAKGATLVLLGSFASMKRFSVR